MLSSLGEVNHRTVGFGVVYVVGGIAKYSLAYCRITQTAVR